MCGTQDPDGFYPYSPTRCKKCFAQETRDVRHRNKERAIELKGGACQLCGYKKCLDALVFHHRDPATKNEQLRMGQSQHVYSVTGFVRTWDLIEKEIAKCVLVCKNCHSEIEAGLVDVGIIPSVGAVDGPRG